MADIYRANDANRADDTAAYEGTRCGKHEPGTCNGYGTECSPRHTPEDIMAHRRAERGSKMKVTQWDEAPDGGFIAEVTCGPQVFYVHNSADDGMWAVMDYSFRKCSPSNRQALIDCAAETKDRVWDPWNSQARDYVD